jgi:hypothetical protein
MNLRLNRLMSVRRVRRMSCLALVVLGFGALFGAESASAATSLYASPSGSGSACTQVSPCSLTTAISNAVSGDDVFVFADQNDYNLSSGISNTVGVPIHIHGFNGRARLIFSSGGLRLQAGTADNLYVEGHSGATSFALDTTGTSADRVFVKTTSNGNACFMLGATLTNSVCWAGSSGINAIETDGSNTIRNVTAIGGTAAAVKAFARSGCSCATATDTLVNVIAHSSPTGVDLEANSDGTATMNVNVTYSNYSTTSKTGSGAPSMTNINGDGTDQSASPAFVNAATGDFHEASGSPTIDAGLNDVANGSEDLDGNARTINGTTDIGAYEFVSGNPPNTKITKATFVNGTAHHATFKFKAIGRADGFQCKLVQLKDHAPHASPSSFSSCHSPLTYEYVHPGRYTFEVRAFNAGGTDPTPATYTFDIH